MINPDQEIERRSHPENFESADFCDHICTSNCRREGCNCDCGEYHQDEEELE